MLPGEKVLEEAREILRTRREALAATQKAFGKSSDLASKAEEAVEEAEEAVHAATPLKVRVKEIRDYIGRLEKKKDKADTKVQSFHEQMTQAMEESDETEDRLREANADFDRCQELLDAEIEARGAELDDEGFPSVSGSVASASAFSSSGLGLSAPPTLRTMSYSDSGEAASATTSAGGAPHDPDQLRAVIMSDVHGSLQVLLGPMMAEVGRLSALAAASAPAYAPPPQLPTPVALSPPAAPPEGVSLTATALAAGAAKPPLPAPAAAHRHGAKPAVEVPPLKAPREQKKFGGSPQERKQLQLAMSQAGDATRPRSGRPASRARPHSTGACARPAGGATDETMVNSSDDENLAYRQARLRGDAEAAAAGATAAGPAGASF